MAMTEEERDTLVEALAQIGVLRDVVAILLSHIRQDATAQDKLLDALREILEMRQSELSEATDFATKQVLSAQESLLIQFEDVMKSGIRWLPL